MGMHEPGWREGNWERAMEDWRAEMKAHLLIIRTACAQVEEALWANDSARIIADATGRIDDASEALWRLREGPENPDA